MKKNNIEEMKKEYGSDGKYMAAVRRVEELSTDPNFIGYYDKEEAIKQDLEDMRLTGFEEGEASGVKKGLKQGLERAKQEKIEIAKSLMGVLPIEEIVKHTKLSIEEIEKLNN